jgi:hypothetical protein
MKHQSSSPDSTTAMVDKIANIVSDYYDEDAAGRWRKCAQHIADSLTDEAATPGITGHQYRRARYEEPAATPQVSLKRMGLSDGRTDYFVMIKVGDREVSPHVFRDEYKAAYHVALYDWLLTGRGEKPEIVAFGPHDWPARPVDPAQPSRQWPRVFNVRRCAENGWHGEISFARCPTDEELKALEILLRDDHRPAPTISSPQDQTR